MFQPAEHQFGIADRANSPIRWILCSQDGMIPIDNCSARRNTFERRRAIGGIAWEVGFEHDRLVTTVVFSEEHFEDGPMSAHPLGKNILSEGLAA